LAASQYPRISFGIIVLNGEPFTRYCLRSLYPFAYEIIVVEGGHEGAWNVTTTDGHSIDGTLETLLRFKQNEDPENKVQIITKRGYWPQKDEFGRDRTPQSRAYAEVATGDYLWQVDIDEFYRNEDMLRIIDIIRDDESISGITFPTYTFWGRKDILCDSWASRRGSKYYHRLFKWGKGYKYVTHEPPTVTNEIGQDLRNIHWLKGEELARRNIYMYHYSLLLPWQVRQKTLLYQNEKPDYCGEMVNWAKNNYFHLRNPYRVHNQYWSPSWLERFHGSHPPEIIRMMEDIDRGIIQAEIRQTDDVEHMLNAWWYPVGVLGLKVGYLIDYGIYRIRVQLVRVKRQLINSLSTKR